ncbi:MAG: glycosyltransferase [Flavobacteriales bacterium]|nr:glycosyltransferase [Flavobacteriales bacterium]
MTLILVLIGLVICLVYTALMAWIGYWLKRSKNTNGSNNHSKTISIVVPCRNEAHNLASLAQVIKHANVPIVLVDDHSTDNTFELAQTRFPSATVIQSEGEGKKAALLTGIRHTKTNHLLLLDADIRPTATWIEKALAAIHSSSSELLLFPILVSKTRGILQAFEAFDMLGLMTVTRSTANAGKAMLGNGAALSISKEDYLVCANELKSELASGDDVFLVHAMKKRGKTIKFANDNALQVHISPTKNLKSFVGQRIRWGQKSAAYRDGISMFFSWTVLVVSLWFLVAVFSLGYLAIEGRPSTPLFMLIALKILVDMWLAIKARKAFAYDIPSAALFLFSFYYPFYIFFVGIGGFFFRPNWKGRKV